MPSGTELERIARRILTELGNNVAKPWLAIYDRKKEADPFTAPIDMAAEFIPIIEAWIDESGRSFLVLHVIGFDYITNAIFLKLRENRIGNQLGIKIFTRFVLDRRSH